MDNRKEGRKDVGCIGRDGGSQGIGSKEQEREDMVERRSGLMEKRTEEVMRKEGEEESEGERKGGECRRRMWWKCENN